MIDNNRVHSIMESIIEQGLVKSREVADRAGNLTLHVYGEHDGYVVDFSMKIPNLDANAHDADILAASILDSMKSTAAAFLAMQIK